MWNYNNRKEKSNLKTPLIEKSKSIKIFNKGLTEDNPRLEGVARQYDGLATPYGSVNGAGKSLPTLIIKTPAIVSGGNLT